MTSEEGFEEAKTEFERFWKPVAHLFHSATTREGIQDACREAEQVTGLHYCFGIGYFGEPHLEEEDVLSFHGWLHDHDKDMISVWYTHGAEEH